MADSSLDDFFAKKDKSKKSKKKFTTSDQIARELEETGKKYVEVAVKAEKEKPPTTPAIPYTAQDLDQEDAEWRDFEVEKEKDYTGLKIQNLQITDSREDEYEREKIMENEDGEPQRTRDNTSGPWNKALATSNQLQEPEPPSPTPVEVETKEEPKSNVYRPPHARNPQQTSAKTKLSNKTAPEITSDFHFPSLSAAADNVKTTKKGEKTLDSDKGFESVKRGGRTSEDVTNRGPKLDLGNKYNALSQSDMS